MSLSGRTRTTLFLVMLTFVSRGLSEKQVLFYSQPAVVAHANFRTAVNRYSPNRQFIPLHGEYQLLDVKGDQSYGSVNIPSAFHAVHSFVFRRTFQIPANQEANYYLHFEQINGRASIQLNGHTLYNGSHNFLPFRLPVPASLLKDSANVLQITVIPWDGRHPQVPAWIPVNLPRIDNGVTGSVYLEIAPAVHIAGLDVRGRRTGDSTEIAGSVELRSSRPLSGRFSLQLQVRENQRVLSHQNFQIEVDSAALSSTARFHFRTDSLPPWSPAEPARYVLDVHLKKDHYLIDAIQRTFFVRSVTARQNTLQLNGKPVKIQGINYIYQNSRGVNLPNRELMLKDLQEIQEMGFNAVRVGFYPQSHLFYQLTDSLGLLCFQDMPFPLMEEGYLADSLRGQTMVAYLRAFRKIADQHPSVVGIGLGYSLEPAPFPEGLKQQIRDVFSSGYQAIVYANSLLPRNIENDFPDVNCIEILRRNHPQHFLASLKGRLNFRKPLLFSGLSKAISYRVDSSAITQDVQQITELYRLLDTSDWKAQLAGQFILTYSDYYLQTPALQAGPANNFRINTLGMYGLDRTLKKEAETVLQEKKRTASVSYSFTEEKNPGMFLFILAGLVNFLVFLLIYRSLPDFRQDVHRSIRRPHGFYTDLQERRLIPYWESFFLMIILAVNGAVVLNSIFYFFRNNFYMDYLLSMLFPDNRVKLAVSFLFWKPYLLLPILAIGILLFFIVLAVLLWLRTFFWEPRIRLRQAMAISSWTASPFVILMPLGMFFYNLMLVLNSYWILFIILLYFHLWYFLRWINGVRVITYLPYSRAFVYSVTFVGIVLGSVFYYLQNQLNVAVHFRFLFELFRSLI